MGMAQSSIASDTANRLLCLAGSGEDVTEAVVFVDLTYDLDEDGASKPVASTDKEALARLG